MASPFALLPLDYLIEVDDAPGTPGRATEPGYGVERAPLAPWIMYGNLRDQEKRNEFAPYLGRGDVDDIGREYGERLPDPAGAGFWTLIDKQIKRAMSLGARCIEWDNLDSHNVTIALRVFDRTATPRLGVAVKNPGLVDGDQVALIRHPAAQIVIVEEGAGTPAEMDALRRAAGKPDMPVRFVFYGDDRKAAQQCAQQASAFSDMGVTFSPGDEYGHSEHLLLPRGAPTPLPPIGPITMPDTTVTGADILAKARSYIGKFTDDDAPKLARAIGAHWPDLANYAALATTSTAWCGIFAAYNLMQFEIRPPYIKNSNDLDDFMWVDAWKDWGTPVPIGQQQPGDVVMFIYPGILHHVCFYAGNGKYVGGNQSNAVTETGFNATPSAIRRPPVAGAVAAPPDPHPLISLGASGAPVIELQRRLGIAQTGIFDPATDAAVRAYQTAHGLLIDGEVGDETWTALLRGSAPVSGSTTLPQGPIARIAALAGASDLARCSWKDRGRAPAGYIKGMAVAFAGVYAKLKTGDSAARVMAALPAGDINHDALAWYGVTNVTAGPLTLRALFTLLIGLGMRESSGNCYEGRDTSAENFDADTVEAGLFQQSWNSHVASAELPKLLAVWRSSNDDGLLSIFREGLSGSPSPNFGSGDGAAFQALCKSKPLFSVYCAAVGLRTIRQHWGPINRREAEMRPEADALLQQVQAIVDGIAVPPKPLEGEIIPPNKPGAAPDNPDLDLGPIIAIVIIRYMERKMSQQQQPIGVGKLMAGFNLPAVKKLLTPGGAVTLPELLSIPLDLIAILKDEQPAQPALPAPTTTQPALEPVPSPAPIPPAAPAAPVAAPSTPTWLKNLSAGIAMVAGSLGLSAAGIVGAPIGPDATTTGMLLPLLSAGVAALGVPAPVINIVGTLLGALRKAGSQTAA